MDLHLKDKTVVVAGGSAGIGWETACEFAREGARVYITGRREEKLKAAQQQAQGQGLCLHTQQADAADEDAMADFAARVLAETGRLDVWVNNPGLVYYKPFEEYTARQVREMLDVNFTAVWANAKMVSSHMKKLGGGVIVNASSYATILPHASGSIYSAAKAAVASLTRSLAGELAPYNIRVVAYAPSVIETEFTDEVIAERGEELLSCVALRRFGKPVDVARPIVFLSSDAAGFITGVDLEISGGKFTVQNIGYAWDRKAELASG